MLFLLLLFHGFESGLVQHQSHKKYVLAVVEGAQERVGRGHRTGAEQSVQTINNDSSVTITELKKKRASVTVTQPKRKTRRFAEVTQKAVIPLWPKGLISWKPNRLVTNQILR